MSENLEDLAVDHHRRVELAVEGRENVTGGGGRHSGQSGVTRRTAVAEVDVVERLRDLSEEAAVCTACRLCDERTQAVFGDGSPTADLMFVGEGPGYHEDQQR